MKILIAEDDPVGREILRQIFDTKPSYRVTVTDNGAMAWWYLTDPEQDPFDLLISDLDMPVAGGLELIQRVRKAKSLSNLLVLVCSGNKDRDVITELIRVGTNGYILKPYEARDVLAKVESLTANRVHRNISVDLGAGD